MNKFMSLFLMVALIMGFSFAVMADDLDSAKLKVNVDIEENAQMAIVTNDFLGQDGNTLNGLFNGNATVSGEPGYYISDGNSTKVYAQGIWSAVSGIDPVNQVQVNSNAVEMLAIDANTDVTLTMTSDFDDWPKNIPLFFRLSSHDQLGVPGSNKDVFNGPIDITTFSGNELTGTFDSSSDLYNEITEQGELNRSILGGSSDLNGDEVYGPARGVDETNWDTLAVIGNDDGFGWNTNANIEQTDDYLLPFRICEPYLIHVNAGLYLDKIGMVEAGQQSVEVEFIVAAAVDNGDDNGTDIN